MLAKMLKRSFGAIKPISEMDHAPDPELSAIIEKMMKMDLTQRYQSMDPVVADLEAYYLELTGQAPPKEEVADEEELDIERPLHATPPRGRPRRRRRARARSRTGASARAGRDRRQQRRGRPGGRATRPTSRSRRSARSRSSASRPRTQIRDAFRKTLSGMGYRVLLVGDAELAAERFREAPTDAVVFDVDGLGRDGARRLHRHARQGPRGRPRTARRRPARPPPGRPGRPPAEGRPPRRPPASRSR